MSQYKVHTNLSDSIHRSFKLTIPELVAILLTKADNTWALSLGGPGRNCDEHRGGSSTLIIRNPFSGSSAFGGPSSCGHTHSTNLNFETIMESEDTKGWKITALMPQTTQVSPMRTTAEPSAVRIDFVLIATFRNLLIPRPSGLILWAYTITHFLTQPENDRNLAT